MTEVKMETILFFALAVTDVDIGAFARLVAAFPWLADDVTVAEQWAIGALLELRTIDATIAQRVRSFPWVADDITDTEQQTLHSLARLAESDRETTRMLLTLRWLTDDATEAEATALDRLHTLAEINPATAQMVAALPWLADGVTVDEEVDHLNSLIAMAGADLATTHLVLAFPWMADEVNGADGDLLQTLVQFARSDPATAQLVAAFTWLTDRTTEHEETTLETLLRLTQTDTGLAQQVAAFPWVSDDLTRGERWVISGLAQLAEADLALAQRVAVFPWVGDDVTDAEWWAIEALGHFASQDPDLARPWLDRLDADTGGETAALLAVLRWTQHSAGGLLYEDLLQSHFTQSRAVTLPLAGKVNLWAFQTTPSREGEDLTAMMAEAVQATEEFMGEPFPATDVIMVIPVIGNGKDHGIPGGRYWGGRFITVTRYPPYPISRAVIHHEVGHYYFSFGPRWFREGGADFMWWYTYDRIGVESLQARKSASLQRVQDTCLRHGLSTIQQLNEWVAQNPDSSSRTRCHYSLGAHFLLSLYETLGKAPVSAALREIYVPFDDYPRRLIEEDIYYAFLRNTPPDLLDAFHEVYDRIHGGPRPK